MTAKAIMVLGTTSGAGKSWLTTALCRYYARLGLKVAPFKAQNMSNNARVVSGGEIGSAQYFQALAANAVPEVRMNPLLLKPESDTSSQVVLLGQVSKSLSQTPWRDRSEVVWPTIAKALHELMVENDVVVIEGAGSPAEINLKDSDIVNMRVAVAPGWPEAAYNGDYIADIAADFLARKTVRSDDRETTASGDVDDLDAVRQFAVAYLRHEQDLDLKAFAVRFDNYYLESSLYTSGKVDATVKRLQQAGKTFEQDGALWLRSTEYGDDKDRVMRKGDGSYTYFVPDVAYHITKWERGFARVVNIQGTDHHGTIARVRAGLQAANVGIASGYPDYVLHTMVRVMRGGVEVKISKRSGSYVTLRDLIEWTSKDAVRFFLLSRKPDTEYVFDVDLAMAQNNDNPVYYVQYAHARICSVLANWGGAVDGLKEVALDALQSPPAMSLMLALAKYPEMLTAAAQDFAPHDVTFYLRDLAASYHSYYDAERILVDDEAVRLARLALVAATAQVLRNGLAVLGVSAPQKM